MIRILGPEGTPEFRAAQALQQVIVDWYPGAQEDRDTFVWLVVSAQAYGEGQIQDVDLTLLGEFGARAPGVRVEAETATSRIHRLAMTFEVKTHSPTGVRFEGSGVKVRYGNKWKDATAQARDAMFALRRYIQRRTTPPRFVNVVWLRDVAGSQLPKRPHNIIGSDATWQDIVRCIEASHLGDDLRQGTLRSGSLTGTRKIVEVLTAELEPTHLDRKRIERITQKLIVSQRYAAALGGQLLVFKGRGGTGKTANLLRLAHDLYTDRGARVLLLTYNHALASDIRRLLTLMKMGSTESDPMIRVDTVHRFVQNLSKALIGTELPSDGDYDATYQAAKDALKELRPVITDADISTLKSSTDGDFSWDFVLVDECQDWPEDERDLLYWLYGAERVVLADGVDQLTRQALRSDWLTPVAAEKRQIVTLRRTLRLKRSLCEFVQCLGNELGLGDLRIEPVPEQTGGKITIVEGDYLLDHAFHREVVEAAIADGNKPVDLLYCVTEAIDIESDDHRKTHRKQSRAAKTFLSWGEKVWDGVDSIQRKSFPTSVDQLRIVYYESCRGLEGWTTVCLDADRFYHRKLVEGRLAASIEQLELVDPDERAREFAARWLMIPFTRAIDHLVIGVSSRESVLGRILLRASAACGEAAKWVKPTPSV